MIASRTVQRLLANPRVGSGAVRAYAGSGARGESYTEKQARKGRPVSPHVTIYKFPITAISSIMNRVTGVALSVGISGIGALALIGADVPSTMTSLGSIMVIGQAAKFSVAFPLIYHYFGGLRHLMWDRMPEMLETEKVEQSSYVIIGASVGLSAILAVAV